MSLRKLPAFANETEEANWWFENREKHDEELEQAFIEGRVRQGSAAQRLAAAKGIAIVKLSP